MTISTSSSANAPFEFPSNIVNDSFPPADEESPPGADIPSIYANADIDFNIVFSYSESSSAGEGEEAETVSVSAPILEVKLVGELPFEGAEIEIVDNETVKIKGRSTGLFTDEIFRFLFDDKSELNLTPDNTENWIAIVKWAAPAGIEETATYTFEVTYDDASEGEITIVGDTVTVEIKQFVYWDFNPSLNAFGQLVTESGLRLKQPSE
jgi:hypothetical protein